MPFLETLLNITPYPRLSLLIWLMILLLALYLARPSFNRVVDALSRGVHNALRLAATSLLNLEKRLRQRNRDVLLAKGLEKSEFVIEREFERYNAADLKNLAGYTIIHRHLSEIITRLEDDHVQSADVAPSLPNWIPIIETVAQIEHSGDTMVSNMLSEINRTLKEQHRTSLENYRNASVKRHLILNKMLPLWRELQKKINSLGDLAATVNDRVIRIERKLDEYEQIRSATDKAMRSLYISASSQFCMSAFLLFIAAAGALLNFQLIRLPMMEIVGNVHRVGAFAMGDVAGLVLTLIEISLGIFIFESMRLTRMFPLFTVIEDKKRRQLMWALLAMLFVFAGIGSSLAILRDGMIADSAALRQTLTGVGPFVGDSNPLSTAGHALLGFLLPFWIALIAVPLESFISSARTVSGAAVAGCLGFLAFAMRWTGAMANYLGNLLCAAYDIIIFPTLWLEGLLGGVPVQIKIPSKPAVKTGTASRPKPPDGLAQTDGNLKKKTPDDSQRDLLNSDRLPDGG